MRLKPIVIDDATDLAGKEFELFMEWVAGTTVKGKRNTICQKTRSNRIRIKRQGFMAHGGPDDAAA